ncbi:MAG: CRTAC1 family protein [Planctomycetes bacterium]|nr:CRTAC1 family protein [Planctomycetota bacterium]MCW8134325.1 CRTAC1 family protein [Planctomycetota bacterium]
MRYLYLPAAVAVLLAASYQPIAQDTGKPAPVFTKLCKEVGLDALVVTRTAWADVNGDGYPDLIVHGHGQSIRNNGWVLINDKGKGFLPPDAAPFRNRDGKIEGGRVSGFASAADVDNDGDQDLFTGAHYNMKQPKGADGTFIDRTELMLNDGKGGFSFVKPEHNPWLAEPSKTTSSVSWLDFNLDGKLDAYVANWYSDYGRSYDCFQSELYQGDGKGGFVIVTGPAKLETAGKPGGEGLWSRPAYGCGAFDYDNDGFMDIFVPAYGRQWNLVFRNKGDGTFEHVADKIGLDGDEQRDGKYPGGRQRAEPAWRANGNTFDMAPGDFDNDGDMDVFCAEIAHGWAGPSSDLSAIYENLGPAHGYKFKQRLDLIDRAPPALDDNWGDTYAAWIDVDNDGRLDLLTSATSYPGVGLKLWKQGQDGKFMDATVEYGLHMLSSHGLSIADFDRDGFVDIAVAQYRWPDRIPETKDLPHHQLSIFRNKPNGNNWLALDVVGNGKDTNRDAVGALVWVTVGKTTRMFQVTGGSGQFAPHSPRTIHIGLGAAKQADAVRIVWPNKQHAEQKLGPIKANSYYKIEQGKQPAAVK